MIQEQIKAKFQEAAKSMEERKMEKNTKITVEEDMGMLIGAELKKQEVIEVKGDEVVAEASQEVAGAQPETVATLEEIVDEEVVTGDESESALVEEKVATGADSVGAGEHKGIHIAGMYSGMGTEKTVEEIVPNRIKKQSKSELKSKLVEKYPGTEFVLSSEARLTAKDGKEPYLRVTLKKDKKSGDRIYHLDEIIDGVAQCQNSVKADFTAAVLRKQGVALEDFIINRQGDYAKNLNKILSVLQCIEINRLLEVDSKRCINQEVMSIEDFMQRLEKFLLNNPLDERIAYIKSEQLTLIGVVGRGNYTAYQNFKRLVSELAPENDAKRMKDNLFAEGCFVTDYNGDCKDCQKTLSDEARKNADIRGDKMYAFKFKVEFMNNFKQKYDEATKIAEQGKQEQQVKQDKSQKGGM